ncbi:MAG: hypothetical protein MHM6MM_004775 [Cercozoa sp. M6MM]
MDLGIDLEAGASGGPSSFEPPASPTSAGRASTYTPTFADMDIDDFDNPGTIDARRMSAATSVSTDSHGPSPAVHLRVAHLRLEGFKQRSRFLVTAFIIFNLVALVTVLALSVTTSSRINNELQNDLEAIRANWKMAYRHHTLVGASHMRFKSPGFDVLNQTAQAIHADLTTNTNETYADWVWPYGAIGVEFRPGTAYWDERYSTVMKEFSSHRDRLYRWLKDNDQKKLGDDILAYSKQLRQIEAAVLQIPECAGAPAANCGYIAFNLLMVANEALKPAIDPNGTVWRPTLYQTTDKKLLDLFPVAATVISEKAADNRSSVESLSRASIGMLATSLTLQMLLLIVLLFRARREKQLNAAFKEAVVNSRRHLVSLVKMNSLSNDQAGEQASQDVLKGGSNFQVRTAIDEQYIKERRRFIIALWIVMVLNLVAGITLLTLSSKTLSDATDTYEKSFYVEYYQIQIEAMMEDGAARTPYIVNDYYNSLVAINNGGDFLPGAPAEAFMLPTRTCTRDSFGQPAQLEVQCVSTHLKALVANATAVVKLKNEYVISEELLAKSETAQRFELDYLGVLATKGVYDLAGSSASFGLAKTTGLSSGWAETPLESTVFVKYNGSALALAGGAQLVWSYGLDDTLLPKYQIPTGPEYSTFEAQRRYLHEQVYEPLIQEIDEEAQRQRDAAKNRATVAVVMCIVSCGVLLLAAFALKATQRAAERGEETRFLQTDWSITRIVGDSEARRLLRDLAKKKLCSENVDFLVEMDEFMQRLQQVPEVKMLNAVLQRIYAKFVDSSSSTQVNFDHELFERMRDWKHMIDQKPIDELEEEDLQESMWATAMEEIRELLKANLHTELVRSQAFRDFVQRRNEELDSQIQLLNQYSVL